MASSWVAPRTWVTAEVPPASTFNIHVRDNLSWLGNDAPACRVRKNSDQSIATGLVTPVPITFPTGDATEDTDPQAMHSLSVNPTRVTVPAGMGGLYAMGGNIEWDVNATGTRIAMILLNGTTQLVRDQRLGVASYGIDQSVSTIYRLAANDYIELAVMHDRGSALLVKLSAARSPCLWTNWLQN